MNHIFRYFRASAKPDWQMEVLRSLCLFVCHQTCERDILKVNKSILMQIGTSGPHGNGTTTVDLGVRRSKFNVTQGLRVRRSKSHKA